MGHTAGGTAGARRAAPAALHGLRVIEVGGGIAGPIAAMLLADAGAEVVKVEPPAGDPARADPGFAAWNRGKRSIVADLSSAAGRSRLDSLLPGADVLVAGCSGRALAGWRLEPAATTAAHARLVHLHLPPYLDEAPWAGGAESHALLAAASGTAMRQASWDGGPIELVYPHPLYAQGAWAAACVVAALVQRERTGEGQAVTVTGMHGVEVTSSGALVLEAGRPPRDTAVGPGGANPCYSRYACADGRWLFLGALTRRFQERAFAALGLTGLLDDGRIAGHYERLVLPANREWVRSAIAGAFAARTRADWLEALTAVDCPAGPLADRDGWLDHAQVEAIGMRLEVDDPERGRVVVPGNPLVLTRSPNVVPGPAPRLGAHDDEPLDWRPVAPRAAGAAPGASGPLEGLRVLDLGTILAGPFAGCLLAELGADVLKVEPPEGDSFRDPGFTFNRGMRSLAIDLRDPRGHDAFAGLVRRADVVIDNYRPGVLGRLGIDHAALERIRPGIVSLSITGFGEGGPLSREPGFDPILQALSGMMNAQGGDDEPVFHNIAVNDVAAAAMTALGTCLALFHLRRAGEGQRVWTSLAGMAGFMQSGELVRFRGRRASPTGGRDHRGRGPLDRFYPVAEGWVRVEAGGQHVPSLAASGLLGTEPPAGVEAADAALAASLASLSREDAVARLTAAGVPAAPARRFEELPDDRAAMDAEVLHRHERPDGPPYWTAGRFAFFSRTPLRARLTAPGLGEHSREVLLEAGLTEATVDELVAGGVVVTGPPLSPRTSLDYR
jgi:crotonobetainyl-CoA:carnitine CoA-transferase CaiB-like acyl-CoA transferase